MTQLITPSQHEKNEWRRMALNAYDTGRDEFGRLFDAAASTPYSMPVHKFDALQSAYRAWLVFGEWKPVLRVQTGKWS